MQVTAFSTPTSPEWRWRICNYAGEMVEELTRERPVGVGGGGADVGEGAFQGVEGFAK